MVKNPGLIRSEIKRRIQTIQESNPTKQRKDVLSKKIKKTEKTIEKLLDAYQEDLLQLDELRSRIPDLRKREKILRLLVKDILIDDDTIRIRHSIPSSKVNSPVPIGPDGGTKIPSCLLRSKSQRTALRSASIEGITSPSIIVPAVRYLYPSPPSGWVWDLP